MIKKKKFPFECFWWCIPFVVAVSLILIGVGAITDNTKHIVVFDKICQSEFNLSMNDWRFNPQVSDDEEVNIECSNKTFIDVHKRQEKKCLEYNKWGDCTDEGEVKYWIYRRPYVVNVTHYGMMFIITQDDVARDKIPPIYIEEETRFNDIRYYEDEQWQKQT